MKLHTTISTSRDQLDLGSGTCRVGGLNALLRTSLRGAADFLVRLADAALRYVEVLDNDWRFLLETRDGPDWSWRDSNSSSSYLWFYGEIIRKMNQNAT